MLVPYASASVAQKCRQSCGLSLASPTLSPSVRTRSLTERVSIVPAVPRFLFLRARVDYDTLASNARGQFLFGYTPNPGTAFYLGYNDDLTRNGFNPFTGQLEPGFRRNGRTFFIKMSYLIRRSFGK